jgi:hypothetical protein
MTMSREDQLDYSGTGTAESIVSLSPTMILWLLDEADETTQRKRGVGVITQLNQRIPHLMDTGIIHNEFVVMTSELPELSVQSWLNTYTVNQWISRGLIGEQYGIRILVVPLLAQVDVVRIANFESHVRAQFAKVRSIAQIPLELALLMYVGDRTIKPGVLKNFWPRMYISDRVIDWMGVLETAIVSYATSNLPKWIVAQRAQAHADGKELDAVWLGSSSLVLAERRVHEVLVENLYRRIVGKLRSDDLTQTEIDISRTMTRQQSVSYLQQALDRTQHELKTYLGWTITPALHASEVRAKLTVNIDNVDNTIQLHTDTPLAHTLFGENYAIWLASIPKYDWRSAWRDYIAKDTVADSWSDYQAMYDPVAVYLSNLHGRMSNVFRAMAQEGVNTFFAQIYEQVRYQKGYGIRDIQQNIADYIVALEQTDLFVLNDEVVPISPTTSRSYIQQLAHTMVDELQASERKIVRRRQTVFSLYGTFIRLLVAMPLLLGLAYAFVNTEYHDIVGVVVPIAIVLIAAFSAIDGYSNYWEYARKVRHDFVRDQVMKSVLGIIKHHFVLERDNQIRRLRALHAVYTDLIASFDNQSVEQLVVVDDQKANKYIIQQLVSVFGDTEKVVEAQENLADDLRAVVGEKISFYYVNGVPSLSQYGKMVSEMHQEAQKLMSLPNGYLMLIHNVVAYMLEAPRNRDTVLKFIRSFCARYANTVMSYQYNRLNVFVALGESIIVKQRNGTTLDRAEMLAEGKHWRWLNTMANLNMTPRPSTNNNIQVASHEILLISKYLRPNLIAQNGRHNKYWLESFIEIESTLDHELTMLRIELDYDEGGRK